MKKNNLFLLAFFFIPVLMYSQDVQWEQLNGPFGGTVLSFASNSNGDIFAGADQNQRGVFRSSDGGVTWLAKNTGLYLANQAFTWLVIDDSSYLVAGTHRNNEAKVYKSKDNGESWTQISILGGTSAAVNDSGHIYVINTNSFGQISVSKNAGYTWSHYPPPSYILKCIEINDSGHIFIGGNQTGYRSTDNGATWTSLPIPDGINSFAFAANGDIYAGSSFLNNGKVYKSTDNGDSWTVVNEGFVVYPTHNIVINQNGDIIVGTWGSGIWKSTDNGDTWTQHNAGLGHFNIKAMHISNDGNVYAGVSGGGIYRSDDGGESWQQVGLTTAVVKRLAISPLNENIFALVDGVSRSADNGQSWEPMNSGLVGFDTKAISIKPDGTIFLGNGIPDYLYPNPCIFRSTDNGNSWTVIENGFQRDDVEAITVDNSGNVYAGNYYFVFKSTDNGDNWLNIGGIGRANTLAFNSLGDLFLASGGGGVWRLLKGDDVWTNITGTLYPDADCLFIGSNDYIYANKSRSTDNGITWEPMNIIGSSVSSYAENSRGHLFCGTYHYGDGISRSTDFGDTWSQINTGLPIMDILSVAVDSDDYLYAGTNGYSMFKTTTSTVTSVDKLNYPANFQCLKQNYPNPFNTITTISWQLPINAHVVLKVYDFMGRELKTLADAKMVKGEHSIGFIAMGLPAGIYFYQLQVNGRVETKKMAHLK